MSETNKKEAGVQEETEKDLPETEPVTEPVEESPEATAGTETTEETESAAEDDKESDKETKGKNSFFGKKKKDNKLEQQIEDLTDRLKRNMAEFDNFRKRTEKEKSICRGNAEDLQTVYHYNGRHGSRTDRSCWKRI